MKTLNVIAVVESATIAQAVEVTYKDFALSVTAMSTVENVGDNNVVVGTPMSKYFGTELRMHHVARDINTGRFVSIKDTMDAIVDVAIEQGYDLLGFDLDDSDEDSQSIIVTDSQSNMLEKEEVITVTEESVMEENSFIPEPIIINESKAVPTATRLNGGFTLPTVNFEFKKVDLAQAMDEVVIEPQPDLSTIVPVDNFDPMDQAMMDYHQDMASNFDDYDLGNDVIPYFGADMSHTEIQVEEIKPMSKLDIILETSATIVKYFRQNCSLKSLNVDQIRQQFAIIYRKHMIHLHSEATLVGSIIKHVITSLTTAYGRRTYVYKDVFMKMLSDVLKDMNIKATKKYAA